MLRDLLIFAAILGAGILIEKRVRNIEAGIAKDTTKGRKNDERDVKIQTIKDETAAMNLKVDVLLNKQSDLEKELLHTKEELKSALSSEKKMKVKISDLESESKKSEQLRTELQSKLTIVEKDVKSVEDERNDLRKSLVTLQKDHGTEQDARKNLENDVNKLQKELREAKDKESKLEDHIGSLQKEMQSIKDKETSTKKEMETLRHDMNTATDSDNGIKNNIATLKKDVDNVNKMGSELKTNLANLQNDLKNANMADDKLKESIATLQKGRQVVAFHVVGTDQKQLAEGQLLTYSKVITNVGNGYAKGYFVAPVKGLYMFSLSAMSPKGKQLHLELVKNGNHIAEAFSGSAGEEMGSQTATVILQAGEKAWVRHHISRKQKEDISSETFNSFSGFLISSDV